MIRSKYIAIAAAVLSFTTYASHAQTAPDDIAGEGVDNPRANVHIGAPIAIPLNPTARAVHLGFGINVGAGYNFSRRHGLVGEFLWNDLLPTNEALAKLRTTLNDPSLHANTDISALTGNYRFELRGRTLGAYFLGGAGLFYRNTNFTKEVVSGNSIQCTPEWLWWGFQCTSGIVTQSQTVGSFATTGPDYNGGIGFTFRVGEPPYRIYAESRYHYAPNSQINTQLVEITFGIRY
jgi:hypothetical protein